MTKAEAEVVCSSGPVCVRYTVDARGRMVHAGALLGLALSSTALASTDPEPDSAPWWSRAAQAVQDWWWPPKYENIEENHVMGDFEPIPPDPPSPERPLLLEVALERGVYVNSFEVNCADGFRGYGDFELKPAQLAIPESRCQMTFPETPGSVVVTGGKLLCTDSPTLSCKEM